MNLETDGKKRLEAMKKRLAAGLPLAGLLAASAVAGAAEARRERVMMGALMPVPPREERPFWENAAPRSEKKPVAAEPCDTVDKPGFPVKADEADFPASE